MSQYCNLQDRMYEGVGEYGIPEIQPVYEQDANFWLGFNYVKSTVKSTPRTGVHFFLDDYQFDRVWYSANTYIPYLKKFSCVLSPDFSLYTDFPKAVQIFNHYRKHWCAAYWQEHGLTVIPTIAWSDKESFEWCFDGEPEGGIVAVSNIGCMRNKDTRKAFNEGYEEMLVRLQPKEVLFYAHTFDDYKGPVHYIRYMNGLTDMVI